MSSFRKDIVHPECTEMYYCITLMYCITGIFTAAFDNQIEWLIVKGICDYADGAEGTAESWSNFASVMAASVAAHILSDPCVFRSWPNYGGNVVHTLLGFIFSLTCARLSCFRVLAVFR